MNRRALESAVLSGVGVSDVSRWAGVDPLTLTVDAVTAAITDAGLEPADIDGVCTWPGAALLSPGGGGPSAAAVQDAFGMELTWFSGTSECPGGPFGAIAQAIMAVASGLCRHVVVFHTLTEGTERRRIRDYRWYPELVPEGVDDYLEWLLPYGAFSAAHWLAPYATRYMADYRVDRADLAAVALHCRNQAALTPRAIYTDPLTLDDYLDAPMVVAPLCRYDCDVPVDVSSAFVVSDAAYAPDAPNRCLRFEASGTALKGRPSYDQNPTITQIGLYDASAHLWTTTDFGPTDIDVVGLYDGFSILSVLWAEALGLAEEGGGAAYFAEAVVRGPGVAVGVNTDGGQLSAGRLHGFGFILEAADQLRGSAGARQVPDAESALVTLGAGPVSAAFILTV